MKKKIMCTMFLNGLFAGLPYGDSMVTQYDEKQNCTKVVKPYAVEKTLACGEDAYFVF